MSSKFKYLTEILGLIGGFLAIFGFIVAIASYIQAENANRSGDIQTTKSMEKQDQGNKLLEKIADLQQRLLEVQERLLTIQSSNTQSSDEQASLVKNRDKLKKEIEEAQTELQQLGFKSPEIDIPPTATTKPVVHPTPTVDLSMGPNQGPSQGSNVNVGSDSQAQQTNDIVNASSAEATSTPLSPHYNPAGNLISCVPKGGWLRIYRLKDKKEWERIPGSITSMSPNGYIKQDGLPVDISSYGGRGHPYYIEAVVNNQVVKSTGNFMKGEPEFRIYPDRDNHTPWQCN